MSPSAFREVTNEISGVAKFEEGQDGLAREISSDYHTAATQFRAGVFEKVAKNNQLLENFTQ